MKSYIKDDSIVFDGVDNLNIALTLDCGQAFRWVQKPNGAWHGVAEKRAVDIIQDGDKITVIGDTDENFWQTYFDLDRDYGAICEKLETDSQLRRAISEYGGIRILRQNTTDSLDFYQLGSADIHILRGKHMKIYLTAGNLLHF